MLDLIVFQLLSLFISLPVGVPPTVPPVPMVVEVCWADRPSVEAAK
jgi:hypothetical protein